MGCDKKQDSKKIDEMKKTQPEGNKEKPNTTSNDDDIEIVDEEDELDIEASYQEWLKDSRRRGFKRTNPSSSAERMTNAKPYPKKTNAESTSQSKPPHKNPEGNGTNFVRYCHSWNNLGNCTYDGCKFVHESAPICGYDGNCSRPKCMFTHKKQNMNFLSKKVQAPVNPWQAMGNPWANQFAFPPNPWQTQSNPWQNQPNPWKTQPNPWQNPPKNTRN